MTIFCKKLFFFGLVVFFCQTTLFSDSPKDNEPCKTVLLTGAAGFIGSNFLEYMFQKHPNFHFIVLDALTYAGSLENIPENILKSGRVKFVHGSVVDFATVDPLMKEANFVVHFAAETHVTRSIFDDYLFFETDVMGTRTMMSALVKHRNTVERFIHISTSEVYGTAQGQSMDEKHPMQPRSPYAAAKAAADRLVFAYKCTYNVPVVIVRPFNNYGPRQHIEKMIPRFITAAIQNEPLTIHGTGMQKRDWIHTYDVAVALDRILMHPNFNLLNGQEINLGSGQSLSVVEIAKCILKHFNLPESQLKYVSNRPGQVDSHVASIEKAKKLLNWSPTISFEKGLETTINWYVQHPTIWKKMKQAVVVPIQVAENRVELQ